MTAVEILANPILVEVTRGAMVESRHRGAVAVADAAGTAVLALGAIEAPVYPRSAIKPLQALALVESGAADAFGLGAEEIALACASHSGEPRHVAAVETWLHKIGCGVSDLECGAQLPTNENALRELLRQGRAPTVVHNNCSGKHAGFLTVARHMGNPIKGYIGFDHPVQQLLRAIISEICGADLEHAPRGIDGCGIPVLAVPLVRIAAGMARMAAPENLPGRRREAAKRIRAAMAAHPFLVGGTGRFGTAVMEAAGEQALVKGGAEGVYCAMLPTAGLGIALKIDDGAGRAAEVAMGSLLRRFKALDDARATRLAARLEPAIVNWAGREVGRIRPAESLLG
jgi:L-asparaginase II